MGTYTITCKKCGKQLERDNKYRYKYKKSKQTFCSRDCWAKIEDAPVTSPCGNCGLVITRDHSQFKKSKSGLIFCGRSCSAKYNSKTKLKSRRSKMEKLLFSLLREEFPNLDIVPNDRLMLDGYEIDILIPSLKFGIEWNGIVHFQPIYGTDKLKSIQQRDRLKAIKALEKGIELAVIPDLISTPKYVETVFKSIANRIKELLSSSTEI